MACSRFPALLLPLAALALAACGPAGSPEPEASAGPAYRVFVSNELSGDVSVIDPRTWTVTATIPVGKRPRGLRISPDGRFLYVALSGSPIAGPGVDEAALPPADKAADGIGVVDLGRMKLARTFTGVSDPEQLSVSKDGRLLFIASEDTGTAVIMDATSGRQIASLPVGGEPEGVNTSPDGRWVYMTSEEDSTVAVIDAAARSVVARLKVGERPRNTAFTADGSRAYVPGEFDRSITVIDAVAHRPLRTAKLAGDNVRPMGAVVAPDAGTLYVTTGRGGDLVALDAETLGETGRVAVGARPWGLAMSPDGRRLFTANGPSNDVAVVDAATMRVLAKVKVGERPWGVEIAVPPGH